MSDAIIFLKEDSTEKVFKLFKRLAGNAYQELAGAAFELSQSSGKSAERAMADVLTEKQFKKLRTKTTEELPA